jgi:hypothetical protein
MKVFMRLSFFALGLLSSLSALAAGLGPQTERSYQTYLANYESKLAKRNTFLFIDSEEGLRDRVRKGEIFVEERRPSNEPPNALIHHYEGAVFIPNTKLDRVLAFLQDYDNHKKYYAPEVIDSRILEHDGNHFRVRMRLLKKKVLTVVLETEHDVRYQPARDGRWESSSRSTKVSEVENPGSARERQLPPGSGHGFVWHMDSYWRLEEADGGVYVECTSISLSRDIPLGMTRLLRPIIEELPQQSLRLVLRNTRKGLSD